MKKIQMAGLSLLVAISASATAQYGQAERRDYPQRQNNSQGEFQRNFVQQNWGFREEDGFLRRLDLTRQQEFDIHQLQLRTQGHLDMVITPVESRRPDWIVRGDARNGLSQSISEYHRNLRRILTQEQNARFTNAWQDEMRRHRSWWTWQIDLERGIAGRNLDRRQRSRFNDLNREIGRRIGDAASGGRVNGRWYQNRTDFARQMSDATNYYHDEVMRILRPDQRQRFESDFRYEAANRSDEEKFRTVWVSNL